MFHSPATLIIQDEYSFFEYLFKESAELITALTVATGVINGDQ